MTQRAAEHGRIERAIVAGRAHVPEPTRQAPALVCGLCICGGMSRRMGRDKAELDVGGRTLLERTVATLSAIAPPRSNCPIHGSLD